MTIVADVLALTDTIVPGYRDLAPDGTPYPFLVVVPDIVPARRILSGDGRTQRWESQHQIDVWEIAADENDTLRHQIVAALDGASGTDGRRAFRATWQRLTDRDTDNTDLVRTLITLTAIEKR